MASLLIKRIKKEFFLAASPDERIDYLDSLVEWYGTKIVIYSLGKFALQELEEKKRLFFYRKLFERARDDIDRYKTFASFSHFIDRPHSYALFEEMARRFPSICMEAWNSIYKYLPGEEKALYLVKRVAQLLQYRELHCFLPIIVKSDCALATKRRMVYELLAASSIRYEKSDITDCSKTIDLEEQGELLALACGEEVASHRREKWRAYVALHSRNIGEEERLCIEKSAITSEIAASPNPSLRFTLYRELVLCQRKSLKRLAEAAEVKGWRKLIYLLVLRLGERGFSEEEVERTYQTIAARNKFLGKRRYFDSLVNFLLLAIERAPYGDEECRHIVGFIKESFSSCASRNVDRKGRRRFLLQFCHASTIITLYGRHVFLDLLSSGKDLGDYLRGKFTEIFSISDDGDDKGEGKNLKEKYEATFARFRREFALFDYATSIQSLPQEQQPLVKAALNSAVEAILNGTLMELRYESEKSDHIKRLLEKRPQLASEWEGAIPPKKIGEIVVEIANKAEDRYIHATDIGNCLSVFTTTNSKRVLPAYLLNGELFSLVARVEKGGRIVAASDLLLLFDDRDEPVILQYSVIPSRTDPSLIKAMERYAEKHAAALELPLYRYNPCAEKAKSLRLYSGHAPYLYLDSHGTVEKGVHDIRLCEQIPYRPGH